MEVGLVLLLLLILDVVDVVDEAIRFAQHAIVILKSHDSRGILVLQRQVDVLSPDIVLVTLRFADSPLSPCSAAWSSIACKGSYRS